MLQKVHSYIQEHQLLTTGEPVVVGVSGGADSIALLHILISLGYKCIIAHCNFHLRQEESDRDEEFVRNFANENQIPFYKKDFNTIAYSRQKNISIEMAARDLRYAWFYEILEKKSAQAIAIAHHADDNIETLLMNLVRGTGVRGLTGIPVKNNKVIRPLLCSSRAEIEQYLHKNKLNYVEDSTNKYQDYKRNKIRNAVIPLLEEINPSVRQTLYESVDRFQDTYNIYTNAIDYYLTQIVSSDKDIIKIDISKLKKIDSFQTVLFEILYPYGFTPSCIQQIAGSLDNESGKQFFSPTHIALKDRDYIIVTTNEENDTIVYEIAENVEMIEKPLFLKLEIIKRNKDFRISKEKNIIHLDYSKIKFPLKLRHWQAGDSFFPFGMIGRKNISDFFIDEKMSILEKEKTWLLLSDVDIVWVVGKRTDNRFKISDETKNILQITLKKA